MADSLQRQDVPTLGPGYTIVRELGGGGMSRVFVAREHALDREVVVKVLAPELAESLSAARFDREIRLAAALQEPHIVPVHSTGQTADGLPYYTMPFVRGESLRSRMAARAVPTPEAIAILRDIARALDYAHRHGVVHRDIKPENVLLTSGTAVVTDFGIAKAISVARDQTRSTVPGAPTTALTSLGMSLGTPAYMAPEQAAGDPNVDHRADLYAWGIVAWELLSGRHPFADRTTAQRMIAAQISDTPPALAGVPAALARLVSRCLEKDPAARPQSAAELLAELDAAGTSNVAARGASRRMPRAYLLAGVLGLIAVSAAPFVFAKRARNGGAATPVTAIRSIGVTPFTNLSRDSANEYFSEGVTQEIVDALGRVPGLRVAYSDAASARRVGSAPDARELGRSMNVQAVLQGTIQRVGNHVRVTALLVNATDGFRIWSDKLDRDEGDVFALQDELARSIASGLQLTLAPGTRDTLVRVTTTDPEAHNLYLQGMYFWARRGAPNLYKSVTLFQQALARDPKFARAWAGIALAYAIVVTWDDVDVPKTLAKAVDAANKALAIDSTTADAWTAIGQAKQALWQNAEATNAYEKALAYDPNSAWAHQWYGAHLAHLGRFDDAFQHIERAEQIEPLSAVVITQEGRVGVAARQFDRAKRALFHVLELDSTYTTAHELLGEAYWSQGDYASAITSYERAVRFTAGWQSTDRAFLAQALASAGLTDSARAVVADIERHAKSGKSVSLAALAVAYRQLGDTDHALALLDTSVSRFDPTLAMHERSPLFDALRRDPHGARLLARTESPAGR